MAMAHSTQSHKIEFISEYKKFAGTRPNSKRLRLVRCSNARASGNQTGKPNKPAENACCPAPGELGHCDGDMTHSDTESTDKRDIIEVSKDGHGWLGLCESGAVTDSHTVSNRSDDDEKPNKNDIRKSNKNTMRINAYNRAINVTKEIIDVDTTSPKSNIIDMLKEFDGRNIETKILLESDEEDNKSDVDYGLLRELVHENNVINEVADSSNISRNHSKGKKRHDDRILVRKFVNDPFTNGNNLNGVKKMIENAYNTETNRNISNNIENLAKINKQEYENAVSGNTSQQPIGDLNYKHMFIDVKVESYSKKEIKDEIDNEIAWDNISENNNISLTATENLVTVIKEEKNESDFFNILGNNNESMNLEEENVVTDIKNEIHDENDFDNITENNSTAINLEDEEFVINYVDEFYKKKNNEVHANIDDVEQEVEIETSPHCGLHIEESEPMQKFRNEGTDKIHCTIELSDSDSDGSQSECDDNSKQSLEEDKQVNYDKEVLKTHILKKLKSLYMSGKIDELRATIRKVMTDPKIEKSDIENIGRKISTDCDQLNSDESDASENVTKKPINITSPSETSESGSDGHQFESDIDFKSEDYEASECKVIETRKNKMLSSVVNKNTITYKFARKRKRELPLDFSSDGSDIKQNFRNKSVHKIQPDTELIESDNDDLQSDCDDTDQSITDDDEVFTEREILKIRSRIRRYVRDIISAREVGDVNSSPNIDADPKLRMSPIVLVKRMEDQTLVDLVKIPTPQKSTYIPQTTKLCSLTKHVKLCKLTNVVRYNPPLGMKRAMVGRGRGREIRRVELPDIEEVRRTNHQMLLAEVAPSSNRLTTEATKIRQIPIIDKHGSEAAHDGASTPDKQNSNTKGLQSLKKPQVRISDILRPASQNTPNRLKISNASNISNDKPITCLKNRAFQQNPCSNKNQQQQQNPCSNKILAPLIPVSSPPQKRTTLQICQRRVPERSKQRDKSVTTLDTTKKVYKLKQNVIPNKIRRGHIALQKTTSQIDDTAMNVNHSIFKLTTNTIRNQDLGPSPSGAGRDTTQSRSMSGQMKALKAALQVKTMTGCEASAFVVTPLTDQGAVPLVVNFLQPSESNSVSTSQCFAIVDDMQPSLSFETIPSQSTLSEKKIEHTELIGDFNLINPRVLHSEARVISQQNSSPEKNGSLDNDVNLPQTCDLQTNLLSTSIQSETLQPVPSVTRPTKHTRDTFHSARANFSTSRGGLSQLAPIGFNAEKNPLKTWHIPQPNFSSTEGDLT